MTEKINKIIIEHGGKEYEFTGGQGSAQPGPDSVGSEEIKDGSVQMHDLSDEARDQIVETDEIETIGTDAARKMVRNAIAGSKDVDEDLDRQQPIDDEF